MCFYRMALRPVIIHFYAVTKGTTNKNSIKTYEKTLSKPESHILLLKLCSIEPPSNANNVVCDLTLMRLGHK